MSYIGKQPTPVPLSSADIEDGTIVNADIAAGAAISASKISGLATVATTGAYSDVTGAPTISTYGATLVDDADAAAARTTLGLGTMAVETATDYAELSGATFTGDVSGTNVTLTGYLRGPSSFTIDPAAHGDDTGTVVIAGNLQVDGTTTAVNSTTMDVADLNITIADGAANPAAADGAGITVDGASATILYTASTDSWDVNKDLVVNTSGALVLPEGSDLDRPGSPLTGSLRFNTDSSEFEGYNGAEWGSIGGGGGGAVSVTTVVSDIDFSNPANTISLAANTIFTTSNIVEGASSFFKITTNGFYPTFADSVYFADGAAPDWKEYPFWLINFICIDGSTVVATPMGYTLASPKQKFVFHEAGNHTFVVPNNTTEIIAVVIGGGGAPSLKDQSVGSGAGGGAAMKTIAVSPGDEFDLVVGAGGASDTGNNGGTSSLTNGTTATISATGGQGQGTGTSPTETTGGTGTGGDINGTGGDGLRYDNDPSTIYGNENQSLETSSGVAGGAGGGGAPSDNITAFRGGNGTGFAGGGGGGGSDNASGGNGGNGGPVGCYKGANRGFGGGGGANDGTADKFGGRGGYLDGFHGGSINDGAATQNLNGGSGGGPNGGVGGVGAGQRGGGGGGGAFGGGGGGHRTGVTSTAAGGGGAVIILVGHPQPYS